MQRPSALSSLSPQNLSPKNVLHFFLKKPALKTFLYFQETENTKSKILVFQETEALKNFLYFRK